MIGWILLRLKPVGSILIVIFCPLFLFSQEIYTPAILGNYSNVTSWEEISAFVKRLDSQSDLMEAEIIGQSVRGRDIYALRFSASEFGTDLSKIRVMIFAQQHGNEQSGKEGALLLAVELLKAENRYLFERIDLLLVPQVNPDGAELNQRRNAHDADLNRNHVILTEPETLALHRIFDRYLFDVTLDVHEYSPYGEEWKEYGYRKNSDLTIGTTTNPNVSEAIRGLSSGSYLPFIFKYLNDRGFSASEYCPGGPPGSGYFRHSTFDVNDGRQSLGIQNTFSFIQEGMNGNDDFTENLRHRTEGQCCGMLGLLEYCYQDRDRIKDMVALEREKLLSGKNGANVSIQSDHYGNGEKLALPLFSYFTGKDTVVIVDDYRPVVKSVRDVSRPAGYLVPKSCKELADWVERQSFATSAFSHQDDYDIGQYYISSVDSIDFEGDMTVNPTTETRNFQGRINPADYIFIPTDQLKCNLLILALEPESELGLVTYRDYAHLLKAGELFPVLRVMEKSKNLIK